MWDGMCKSESEFSGIYQYMLDYFNAKRMRNYWEVWGVFEKK